MKFDFMLWLLGFDYIKFFLKLLCELIQIIIWGLIWSLHSSVKTDTILIQYTVSSTRLFYRSDPLRPTAGGRLPAAYVPESLAELWSWMRLGRPGTGWVVRYHTACSTSVAWIRLWSGRRVREWDAALTDTTTRGQRDTALGLPQTSGPKTRSAKNIPNH